jgi:ubiquinone/menaquinone biosynthesis C-methylase UbiE
MPEEKTFKAFTPEQGANYAKARPGYNPDLFKLIIEHHTSTGGKRDVLLDVGCGPGTTALALAPQFAHVIGLDASEGMIESARSLGGTSSASEPIRYEVSSAESLGTELKPPVEEASVDMITASTAAHWFDMARFWARAAQVLKPGGTVAIWCSGSIKVDPSMPNAAAIRATIDKMEERDLKPYIDQGNLATRNLYVDMPLPWTLTPPVGDFNEASFFRKEWGPENFEEFFVGSSMTVDMNTFEMVMSSMSPVQRWREANPDAVGTEREIVRAMRRKVEQLLHEAGVEKGKEIVKGSGTAVLLMVKKKV